MNKALLVFLVAFGLCGVWGCASPKADPAKEVLGLERQALDGWLRGNPAPFLAMTDPGITYFHVMTNGRLDGRPAVQALFEPYRGTPLFDRYEILDPQVRAGGDVAVLSYILVQHNGANTGRWNATQVYQRQEAGWRVVHSHWSQTAPALPPPPAGGPSS